MSDDAAAAELRQAAAEANASESLIAPFATALAHVRDLLPSLTLPRQVRAAWANAITEHLTPALGGVLELMVDAVCADTGLDPASVPPAFVADVAKRHLQGVIAYGELLEGVLAKRPDMPYTDALAGPLAPERADLLADGFVVHVRNGVTVMVLGVADPLALAAAGEGPIADPRRRHKMWVTMRDSRVRRAHASTDTQIRFVTQQFTIPYKGSLYRAWYPGDPSLPPALRINCRCLVVPVPPSGIQNPESSSQLAESVSRLVARRRKATRGERLARREQIQRAVEQPGPPRENVGPATYDRGGIPDPVELDTGPLPIEGPAAGGPGDPNTVTGGSPGAADNLAGGGGGIIIGLLAGLLNDLRRDDEQQGFAVTGTLSGRITAMTSPAGTLQFINAGPDYSDGVMVCMRPDGPDRLAMDGGLAVDDLHMTLAFFGTTDECDGPCQQQMAEVIGAEIAPEYAPLTGEITAVTVLPLAESDSGIPLVALIDAPGLGHLRDRLVRALSAALADDNAPKSNHDFLAHITLGYNPTDDDLAVAAELIGTPLAFDALEISWGTESSVYLLEGDSPIQEDPTMPATIAPDTIAEAKARRQPVELAVDPQTIAPGDCVSIDGTDAVGMIEDVVVEGEVPAGEGADPIMASPENPVIVVRVMAPNGDVFEPTDQVLPYTADQVTGIEPLPMAGPDAGGVEGLAAESTGATPDTAEFRSNAERAAAGDFDWEGVAIVEGMESGDRRFIEPGALTYRDLPLTLMVQLQNPETGGHALAIPGGSIWHLELVGHEHVMKGFFDSGEGGQTLKRMLGEGTIKGVSADIDMVEGSLVEQYGKDPLLKVTRGRIMGVTATPFPAFQEAYMTIVDDALAASAYATLAVGQLVRVCSDANFRIVGEHEPLVASGAVQAPALYGRAPELPPRAWFEQPVFEGPTPVVVTPEGRIYGHVADWSSCHIGYPNRCVTAPRSNHAYSYFVNKNVLTAEGVLVPTGPICTSGGHAPLGIGAAAAKQWMDDTRSAAADVAVYEDAWGIAIAGAVRPSATSDQVRALRGSDISPHWEPIDRKREMVGMVCVNVSGFITPQALAASAAGGDQPTPADGVPRILWDFETDEPLAMVAVGMVRHAPDPIVDLARRMRELEDAVAPLRADRVRANLSKLTMRAQKVS